MLEECWIKMDKRLSDVENAITKITTLQEVQSKQMDVLIEGNGTVLVIANTVNDHSRLISKLSDEISRTNDKIYKNKEEVDEDVTDARDSILKNTLVQSVTILTVACTVAVFLFEYNRSDIQKILITRDIVIGKLITIESDIQHNHKRFNK